MKPFYDLNNAETRWNKHASTLDYVLLGLTLIFILSRRILNQLISTQYNTKLSKLHKQLLQIIQYTIPHQFDLLDL
jgi:hypothetical protein